MPNAELAYKVLDHILAHPDQHDQRAWVRKSEASSCGTAACFAGWAVLLTGKWEPVPDPDDPDEFDGGLVRLVGEPWWSREIRNVAALELGIAGYERGLLFDPNNTIEDLQRKARRIFGERPA